MRTTPPSISIAIRKKRRGSTKRRWERRLSTPSLLISSVLLAAAVFVRQGGLFGVVPPPAAAATAVTSTAAATAAATATAAVVSDRVSLFLRAACVLLPFLSPWSFRGRFRARRRVTSRYVTSRYVTLRYVTLRYVTSRHVLLLLLTCFCMDTAVVFGTPLERTHIHQRNGAHARKGHHLRARGGRHGLRPQGGHPRALQGVCTSDCPGPVRHLYPPARRPTENCSVPVPLMHAHTLSCVRSRARKSVLGGVFSEFS